MKKVLSGMLVLTMMFSLLVPAVAAETPTDEIIGEIFYESEPVGYLTATAGEQLLLRLFCPQWIIQMVLLLFMSMKTIF